MRRILLLLREIEIVGKDSNWVFSEACNGRSLQSGGTFQNVLVRKFDNVIIPVFASVIKVADSYFNLEMLYIPPRYI